MWWENVCQLMADFLKNISLVTKLNMLEQISMQVKVSPPKGKQYILRIASRGFFLPCQTRKSQTSYSLTTSKPPHYFSYRPSQADVSGTIISELSVQWQCFCHLLTHIKIYIGQRMWQNSWILFWSLKGVSKWLWTDLKMGKKRELRGTWQAMASTRRWVAMILVKGRWPFDLTERRGSVSNLRFS